MFSCRIVCIPNANEVAEKTGCLLHYIRKGIALSCYVYGRCLSKGYGIKEDKDEALRYYSKVLLTSFFATGLLLFPLWRAHISLHNVNSCLPKKL